MPGKVKLAANFPKMSDADKVFLIKEGMKWEKENKGSKKPNPFLSPGTAMQMLLKFKYGNPTAS